MKKEMCPAWGETCDLCKGLNHFKVVCSKSVHGVRQESDSDSDSSYDIISSVTMEVPTLLSPSNNPILCKMLLSKRPVEVQVDCDVNVSVLPKKYAVRCCLVFTSTLLTSACSALFNKEI